MSRHYDITTLSDENIARLINDPKLFDLIVNDDEEAYLEYLDFLEIDSHEDAIPEYSHNEKELRSIVHLWGSEGEFKEDSSWGFHDAEFVSYFLKSRKIYPFNLFSLLGEGKEIAYDNYDPQPKVYTSFEIKKSVQKINFNEMKFDPMPFDLEEMKQLGLIWNSRQYEYYDKEYCNITKWAEANIKHLLSEAKLCVEQGVGVVIAST